MKDRLLDINNNCKVKIYNEKLMPDNLNKFNLFDYDYIIDAIDMIQSKVALIEYAYKNNLKIISAMGAGNRFDIPEYSIDFCCRLSHKFEVQLEIGRSIKQ